jgi:squalene-hopene/tetraprenyl-beta-curcumene cyclase
LAEPPRGASSDRAARVQQVADRVLRYLREHGQDDSGAFTPRMGAGITSLVVTAALRHGRPIDDPLVAEGLEAIEASVQPDGGIYGSGRLKNYETCVAITCLVEANKAAGDGRYDETLKDAEAFVRGLQIGADGTVGPDDPEFGGVGYSGKERPDLSNTAYLIGALHALGADGEDPAVQRALAFVSRCQNLDAQWNDTPFAGKVDDGGFYYAIPTEKVDPSDSERYTENGGLRSYGSMTYSGFKSLVYAGLTKDDPRAKASLDWIGKHYTLENNPGQGDAGLYYYYNTFGVALAASQLEAITTESGEAHNWRDDLVAELAERQQENGSWLNTNRQWFENDPNLCTVFALLALSYCD